MAFGFPISLDVAGRRCVVFGAGPGGPGPGMALLDAGAVVTVIARPYEEGDLAGVFLAVVAAGDAAETARIFAEAEREGVLLNAGRRPGPLPLRRARRPAPGRSDGDGFDRWACAGVRRPSGDELSRIVGAEYGTLVDLIGDVRAELRAERPDGARLRPVGGVARATPSSTT